MKLHVAEADTELRSEKHTNKYLMGVFGKSTTVELNRLKNIRRMDYKHLVATKVQPLTVAAAVILAAPSIEEDDKQ